MASQSDSSSFSVLFRTPCRNLQLAHVVQQRSPAQVPTVVATHAQLLGDQVGVDPHPLAVATCLGVVRSQRCDQREDVAGSLGVREVDHPVTPLRPRDDLLAASLGFPASRATA